MTETEKQAIFKLREIIDYDKKHRLVTIYDEEQIEFRNNIELVVDLVEKLQKENEELKNKVVKRDNDIIELEKTTEKDFLTKQEVKENYIAKDKVKELEKENSKLQEKIENLKMSIAINYTENSKLRHIVMSLPNGLEILEKL